MSPKRGDRFEHARQITGSPKAGTARPVVMEVTRVTRYSVYYRPVGTAVPGFPGFVASVERFPAAVGRWIIPVGDERCFYVEDGSLWFHVDDPDDPMDPQLVARQRDLSETVWSLIASNPKVRS